MGHQRATQTRTAEATRQKRVAASIKASLSTGAPVHPILQLQQIIGNQAVNRLIQAKLKIGQPGDQYEQEADRVADQVMRMPRPRLQRQAEPEEEEELEEDEEEGVLQPQATTASAPEPDPELQARINSLRGGGRPLSQYLRTFFEPRFGYNFSQVRVHTDAHASDSARAVEARAFTVGRDVVFGAGEYASETGRGRRLLAHELTHVVQQTSGPSAGGSRLQRQASEGGPTPEPTPEEAAAPALLVEDEVAELAPGQMKKSQFLAELRTEVCRTAEEALAGTGRTTDDCPYLNYWFDYYSQKDSRHIERAIHKYAPETRRPTAARDYIPMITARVRRGVETWVRTGEITEVPEGVPTDLPAAGATEREGGNASTTSDVQLKGRDSRAGRTRDPLTIQKQLGGGHPLESGVRSRMESAFGTSFSHVRAHTDATGAALSDSLNARAFTVGQHIAFGSGEYRPGTAIGDALVAHELAHVVQQRGASHSFDSAQKGESRHNSLEEDADISAVSAVASLFSGVKGVARNALPRLRSGLRLSSCKKGKEKAKELAKECIGAKDAKIITLDRTHPKTFLEIAGCAPGVMKGKVEFYYQEVKFFELPIVGGVFYGAMPVITTGCPGPCKTVEARIFDKKGKKVATAKKTVTDKRLFPQCE